ncbi:MAG: hypothetical protein ACYTCU_10690 [Planctomycetota bacterium]|jgi:hypothetical protein
MSTKQKVGLAGALMLFVGVFLPYVNDPGGGSVSYWAKGGGGGTAIAGFALLSAFLVFVNKSIALWYTGLATLVLLTYSFVEYQFAREDSLNVAQAAASGVVLAEVGELAVGVAAPLELQFGFFVMSAGAVLVLAGAIISDKPAGS